MRLRATSRPPSSAAVARSASLIEAHGPTQICRRTGRLISTGWMSPARDHCAVSHSNAGASLAHDGATDDNPVVRGSAYFFPVGVLANVCLPALAAAGPGIVVAPHIYARQAPSDDSIVLEVLVEGRPICLSMRRTHRRSGKPRRWAAEWCIRAAIRSALCRCRQASRTFACPRRQKKRSPKRERRPGCT